MTEQEWLASVDPATMLKHLLGPIRTTHRGWGGLIRDRKLRLFACACWRAWDAIQSDDAKKSDKRSLFLNQLECVENDPAQYEYRFPGGNAWPIFMIRGARDAAQASARDVIAHWHQVNPRAEETLAALLRCIVGNPWRSVEPQAWRWSIAIKPIMRWRDGLIPQLAQAIYDARDFEALPVLADALEEAGCDNADMLTHLRGPGPHARGCWVVDLLLGKQ